MKNKIFLATLSLGLACIAYYIGRAHGIYGMSEYCVAVINEIEQAIRKEKERPFTRLF